MPDMSDRITQLEELLSHQQHLLDALSEETTRQQGDLQALGRKVGLLEAQLRQLAGLVEAAGDNLPHEKPPHY